jgi:hypothetical protein
MSGALPNDFYNGTLITNASIKSNSTPPLLKDYLIDLDTGYLVVTDSGQFQVVQGLRAVIMQVWRKLHTDNSVYEIFSSKYGNTFKDLIGKGKDFANAYAYSKLESAIVDGVYVTSVDNVKVSLSKSSYFISFIINTIYGNTSEVLNIPLED